MRSPPWSRENRGLRMNTKALGVLSGVVLLALAYGGVHGLVVVGALMLALWVVRSGCLGATAEDAECWRQAEQEREADQRRNETHRREVERQVERERQAQQRRQQAEQEREAERQRQRQREQSSNQPEKDDWWSVLEVSRDASVDEIRRAYRRKIQRCHPDRVIGLAPEFVELAERHTQTLNAAYAEANRARRRLAVPAARAGKWSAVQSDGLDKGYSRRWSHVACVDREEFKECLS